MAKAKRDAAVSDTPSEKPADGAEAAAGVTEAAAPLQENSVERPAPPARPKAAPGMMRLRASRYFKDGSILGLGPQAEVGPDQIIEVTPEVFKQLREAAPTNWTVV